MEVTALDMMNFEWSYVFPRSRTNLSFVVSFIFLGDIVETKLIREATFEAGSDPRGHLWVTWGVYLCAGKPPLADIILCHLPDLT